MTNIIDFFKKEKTIARNSILFIVILSIVIGLICEEYYKNLQKNIYIESSSYLREMSKQMGTNTNRILNDNYAILGTISSVLKAYEDISMSDFKKIINEQKHYWNYKDIMLVDEEGNLYNSNGKTLSISTQDFLGKVVIERKNAMSNSKLIDGKECIVFAIPVNNMHIMGMDVVALCASYEPNTFDEIISTTAFNDKAYTHIIDKQGVMVVRSNSLNAEKCGYNILNYLDDAILDDKENLIAMKNDIKYGNSGIVTCNINGTEKYISYYPLQSNEWCLVTFVPVSVANEKTIILMKISALFCVFIAMIMIILIILLVINFIKHNKKLETIAFVDPITGGNTIQKFQILSDEILSYNNEVKFAMIYINIEKFKLINDQFGRNTGDFILKIVNDGISKNLTEKECIARVMADHFCVMVEYNSEELLTLRFQLWCNSISSEMESQGANITMPTLSFGVYVISAITMPIPFMIDRAKLSLNETLIMHQSKMRYSLYDERKREKLFREKQLEDRMENALLNEEFEVYLQPKYVTATGEIGGAEALIRWNDTNGKMIYPDEFIPLFERNGFIIKSDMWVFEKVCLLIKKWIDSGLEPITISLNCSRVHLSRPDFVQMYRSIFEKYNIPAKYIEIELTESVVYEDTQRLVNLIGELHSIGFTCSIDDFGSGYSSLNMIQDIPVDVLKLDKIFFRNTKVNKERTKCVISGIISMAKALSMKTVAEGVELEEQVEMLKELECCFIQGYVFSRPVPIKDFEKLAFPEVYI